MRPDGAHSPDENHAGSVDGADPVWTDQAGRSWRLRTSAHEIVFEHSPADSQEPRAHRAQKECEGEGSASGDDGRLFEGGVPPPPLVDRSLLLFIVLL